MRRLLLLILIIAAWAVPAHALAADGCETPRRAVATLFDWLQPDHFDAGRAAACLQAGDRPLDERKQLARRIKQVFDARGLFVRLETLPDEPNWFDAEQQSAVAVPHPDFPEVVVARQGDGRWLWTQASLGAVERAYSESFGGVQGELIERLPESLRGKVFGVALWQYLAIFLILLLGLVVRKVIQVVVLSRVRNLVQNLGQNWALKLVDVFASPGATLVMAAMLQVAYPRLRLPVNAALAMSVAVRMMVVVSIVWAAYRLMDVLAERMAEKAAKTESKLDDQLVPLVRKSMKIFTVVAGGLFILQNLNVNVGSLLAGLGIGGVAVALAAKDTIANFFGSIMIFVDRPFQIGDWVVVSGVEGIVEEVGFRSTRIRTFYNSLVTMPNAKFTEASIDNYGVRRYRRTFFTLNVTYDTSPDQMQAFVEGIRAIIVNNPKSRKDYYEVHMSGFGAHSLDVMVYFFFEVSSWTDELHERHNVMLEIMRLAERLRVVFAFPTQTLYLDRVATPGAPREIPAALSSDEMIRVVDGFAPSGQLARPAGPQLTHGYLAGSPRKAGSANGDG